MKNLLILTVLLMSCVGVSAKVVRASKNIVSRSIESPAAFTSVVLSGIADVEYTQSTDGTTSIEIFAPDNVIDLVEVYSAGGILKVGLRPKITVVGDAEITVRASSPSLNGVTVSGAGDFETRSVAIEGDMNITVGGAGDVEFDNLACRKLGVSISGAGSVDLERGTAQAAGYVVSGAGEIDADGITAGSVIAKASGAGEISCHATTSIDASASGASKIEVYGRPSQVSQKASGVGKIYIR